MATRVGQAKQRKAHEDPMLDDPEKVAGVLDLEGRVPPHDLDAEAASLSAIMIDEAALDLVIGELEPEHFYSEAHRQTYAAAVWLKQNRKPVDIVQIATRLKNEHRLEQVGGLPYLTRILDAAPAVRNVGAYASTVISKFRMRSLIATATRLAAQGYLWEGEGAEYLEEAERAILKVTSETMRGGSSERVGPVLRRVYDDLVDRFHSGRPPGVSTGFADLDEKLAGLQVPSVTIVAARPGMGKSAFLQALARNIAGRPAELFAANGNAAEPQGAALFSLEMRKEAYALRMLASEARVHGQRLRGVRNMTDDDWHRVANAAGSLAALPIEIDDTPAIHYTRFRSRVRQIKAEMAREGVKLVLVGVDYLQLMKGGGENVKSREQEVAAISGSLIQVAREEDVAIVALAQLSRDVEKRAGNKRPQLSDLRESGSVEQDADTVIFLYRPEYYGESVAEGEEGKTETIIGKQRNGPTSTVALRFVASCTRFESME